MEGMPLVSIVVPVHNAEAFIAETISSVLAQTYEYWELLLVDDASADESKEVIKTFSNDRRIRLIPLTENAGAAKARNLGIEEAKGDYLAFLDADDLWKPEKLQKQLSFIKRTHAAFTFTSYEFGDEKARPTGRIVPAPESLSYEEALSRTVIFTSTVMVRLTDIASGTGLTKKELRFPDCPSEDTALWWQILRSGYDARGLNDILTIYRRPTGSLSANKLVAIRRIWALYRKKENLGIIKSIRYFIPWALRATLRRL